MKSFRFISDMFNVSVRARRIREDETRREKSVGFAVSSIILSLFSVALAVGGIFLLKLLLDGDNDALVLLIFIIAGLAVCFIGALTTLVNSLVRVIAQLSINKKVIGWVALAVFIAAVVAIIIMCAVML